MASLSETYTGGAADAGVRRRTLAVDAYCGNCRRLEYGHENGRLHPCCTYHDSEMRTMDACESWKTP